LDGSSPSPSATTAEKPVNSHWGHWFHQPDTVLVTVGGNGSVTSSPAGIDCTGSSGCSKSFPVGSTVTLSPFATAATVAAGIGGTTGSGGTTSNGSTQASTPATTQASAQQVISPAFYVSPTGSDSNAGTSAGAPFLTLGKAKTAMEGSSTKVTYLLGGTYSLATPIALSSSDDGESWLAFPGQVPILDGGGTTTKAFDLEGANNVTIRWLTIQHFTNSGIYVQSTTGVFLDSNTVQNISTPAGLGNNGCIFGGLGNPHATITHNLIQNCNSNGVSWLDSNASSGTTSSYTTIAFNALYNTMLTDTDGGAIAMDNRPHLNVGIVVNNNVIGNFGHPGHQAKAIYLDDLSSYVTITNNIIYGTGVDALQIHGGDNNTVQNNIFDITDASKVLLYQTTGVTQPSGDNMTNNVFTENIIYSSAAPPADIWTVSITSPLVPPTYTHNLYWSTSGTQFTPRTYSSPDTNPTINSPGFVNAASNNYNFSSGAPAISGGSFTPIDVSTVGPIPNP